jgi:hypothetical protein
MFFNVVDINNVFVQYNCNTTRVCALLINGDDVESLFKKIIKTHLSDRGEVGFLKGQNTNLLCSNNWLT